MFVSPHRKILSKFFLRKFKNLETYSRFEQKNFGCLIAIPKKNSTCPGGHFQPEIFFEDFRKILFFSDFEKNFWLVILKLIFTCPEECFEGKNSIKLSIYKFIRTLSENFLDFGQKNFQQNCQNCIYMSGGTFSAK